MINDAFIETMIELQFTGNRAVSLEEYAKRELLLLNPPKEVRENVIKAMKLLDKGKGSYSGNYMIILLQEYVTEGFKESIKEIQEETPKEAQIIVNTIEQLMELFDNIEDDEVRKQTIHLVGELAQEKHLTPLTLSEDEFYYNGNEFNIYQNKRCRTVYKIGKNGRPYNTKAYYSLSEEDGEEAVYYYTFIGAIDGKNGKQISKCYIKDPKNMPSIEVKVDLQENLGEVIIPGKWLDELHKYYDIEYV
jgi:hypothetical protein